MSRPLRESSSRNGRAAIAALVFAAIAWPESAAADENSTKTEVEPLTPRVELRHRLWLDLSVTVGVAGATVVWALVKPSLLSDRCVICDPSGSVNAVDDFFRTALKRPDGQPASNISDVFGYGLAPLSAIGLGAAAAVADRRGDEVPLDTLLVAEATVVDIAVDQALLSAFPRERPSFHAIADPDAKEGSRTLNTVSSFPSGHTSAAFAMAASAGTIASMRGYRLAPLVWIVGMAIGGTTAYLRIAADRHYFTDTLTGALVGTGVGIGIPVLFHRPERQASPVAKLMQNTMISSSPVEGGRVVSVAWAF